MEMRKTFLVLVTLLVGVVACNKGGNPQGGGDDTPVVPANYTISGTIQGSDGRLLKDVVVSDGLNCYKTGSDGKY